jgi:hypothetical protein
LSREVIIAGKEINTCILPGKRLVVAQRGPKDVHPNDCRPRPVVWWLKFVNSRGQEVSHSYSLVVGLDTLVGIVECIIISRLIFLV